ncbi:uncharacterized protein LOC135082125 isoform X2 [Ostrinia nubilalis]|uniref:uncharacterized protein LOC135082125 isoform X2 n=1 Tax=Ostrinia nubilalis TaxID=29057 RepID=UPI0030824B03
MDLMPRGYGAQCDAVRPLGAMSWLILQVAYKAISAGQVWTLCRGDTAHSAMLCVRLVLWSWLILQVAYKAISAGQVWTLCRGDTAHSAMLCVRLVLWSWLILQVAYKAISAGQMEGDIRSSSSEISDSSHSNHSTPNRINNKKET